jgi:teichoic acid transport system ATP-binding protein
MDSTTEPGGAPVGSEPVAAPVGAPTIVVDDVHVKYRVYASGKRVGKKGKAVLAPGVRGAREVHALKGVSFVAHEGETVGVIGHNGSGKSTLFRAISGLLPTTSGRIWAEDRPILLGVNAALLPELSGEKNVKLGLLALGFSAAEAETRTPEIAEFADLEEFIEHPMRTYSAGMGARLRFAIAAAKNHSILLIDEALAVGDREFRAKSEERIRELQEGAGTVMVVSHSMGAILEMSTRVIWIDHGLVRMDGDPQEVVDAYRAATRPSPPKPKK